MNNPVTAIEAAPAAEARRHFASLLSLETDCWDVHSALAGGAADFLLVDVRGPNAFAAGHVPGACNVPDATIDEACVDTKGRDRLWVVYCAGPHCNGADRAALRLADLGVPVKKMIGGVTGWLDEGFELSGGNERKGDGERR